MLKRYPLKKENFKWINLKFLKTESNLKKVKIIKTSNQPLISIITICYNPGEDFLPTVKSVLAQTYQHIEYIIVDGASNDGTVEQIRTIEDPRVKWISEKDEGIYDAMNKGIRMATGNWLNFMNAGDAFANDSVLNSINFSEYQNHGLIYGCITKDFNNVIYPKTIELLRYGKIMACHQAMFFNKTVLRHELMYDARLILNGDSELVTRIDHKGFQIEFIDQLIAFYKGGGASNNFIGKAKMQRYQRIWNYYGVAGVARALAMQLGLVKPSKFSIK